MPKTEPLPGLKPLPLPLAGPKPKPAETGAMGIEVVEVAPVIELGEVVVV